VSAAVPVVAGSGSALPPAFDQAELWRTFFADHFSHHRTAEKIWRSSGITTRHFAVDPVAEDIASLGTDARMRRFLQEAMPLGKEAVGAALDSAGLDAADVGLFAVASCTGYVTPGLDILLARDLGMTPDVQRLHIGHMGCYAAVPGLGAVSDFVAARGRPAVLLCCELTSLHVQPPTPPAERATDDDIQQMVAHALFSDAAAAVVVRPGDEAGTTAGPRGLEVVDVVARTDVSTSDHMTWDVTDFGFRMGLSPRVPDVLEGHVAGVVSGLLERHGLTAADIAAWAVHPGGRRILEVVAERLALTDEQIAPSYAVLDEAGNCSSATVLLVLDRLRATRALEPGETVVAMAFGPGLTLYAALLRAR
jgi:predicted naringenin-chalcone synthase